MSESPRICVRCGAPAVVRRGGFGSPSQQIMDLCDACASTDQRGWSGGGRPSRLPRREEIGIILAGVGAFLVLISLLADWLEFGRSEGLGWKQLLGMGLAVSVVALGAVFRALFLVILGVIFGALSVLADWIGFGSAEGFGYQQISGLLLGAGAMAAGIRLTRRRDREAGRA